LVTNGTKSGLQIKMLQFSLTYVYTSVPATTKK